MDASSQSFLDQLLSKFDDEALGEDIDDELFEQSLKILTGERSYFSSPTRYLYPGLPNRQFFPTTQFAWLEEFEAQYEHILSEFTEMLSPTLNGFSPYLEVGGREGASHSQPLVNNPDWSAFYLLKQGEKVQQNIAAFPKTWAAIESIGADVNPAPAPSVLFSLLKPGSHIPAHHGMLNTRLICHLPLIVPSNCQFRVGNETREWEAGKLLAFDDTIEHEAWNRGTENRFVLIFELWRPELSKRQRDLLSKLFVHLGAKPI